MDLTQYTEEELRAALARKQANRRADAIRQLEEVAAKHGFTLADFRVKKPRSTKARFGMAPRGTVKPKIIAMLSDGWNAEEIARNIGHKSSGGVYSIAKRAGIKMKNGRAVL